MRSQTRIFNGKTYLTQKGLVAILSRSIKISPAGFYIYKKQGLFSADYVHHNDTLNRDFPYYLKENIKQIRKAIKNYRLKKPVQI